MILQDDIIKLRSDIIEKLYQMGYSIDEERRSREVGMYSDWLRLEFFRSDSLKITVIIEKEE